MTLQDIRLSLLANATIYSKVGDRVFTPQPLKTPNGTYIEFFRSARNVLDVSDTNDMRFIIYSQDIEELESLVEDVRIHFVGDKVLNGKSFYKIRMVNQTDGRVKLDTGFYFSMIDFDFSNSY